MDGAAPPPGSRPQAAVPLPAVASSGAGLSAWDPALPSARPRPLDAGAAAAVPWNSANDIRLPLKKRPDRAQALPGAAGRVSGGSAGGDRAALRASGLEPMQRPSSAGSDCRGSDRISCIETLFVLRMAAAPHAETGLRADATRGDALPSDRMLQGAAFAGTSHADSAWESEPGSAAPAPHWSAWSSAAPCPGAIPAAFRGDAAKPVICGGVAHRALSPGSAGGARTSGACVRHGDAADSRLVCWLGVTCGVAERAPSRFRCWVNHVLTSLHVHTAGAAEVNGELR